MRVNRQDLVIYNKFVIAAREYIYATERLEALSAQVQSVQGEIQRAKTKLDKDDSLTSEVRTSIQKRVTWLETGLKTTETELRDARSKKADAKRAVQKYHLEVVRVFGAHHRSKAPTKMGKQQVTILLPKLLGTLGTFGLDESTPEILNCQHISITRHIVDGRGACITNALDEVHPNQLRFNWQYTL